MKIPTHHNFRNKTGHRFGRLTVTGYAGMHPRIKGISLWRCLCDCGKSTTVRSGLLSDGTTKSCGCIRSERATERNISLTDHGEAKRGRHTVEFKTWASMKQRCLNPSSPNYHRYGGRGITICKRWMKYKNFLADMGRKPSPELSIERVKNNGNYEPSNCIWGTDEQQNNNKSSNRPIEFNGTILNLNQWAKRLGIGFGTLSTRLNSLGWSVPKAFKTPVCQ